MSDSSPDPATQATPDHPSPTKAPRLLSLDVMRGVTILAMILVNNPGSWSALYWPLGHADWHGWTPTDLIFPFFLFMVGVAMAYSFAKYTTGEGRPTAAVWLRIGRRVVTLIALGLLLAASGRIIRFLLGELDSWDLETLRWPGVLQRIGLAYLGASIVVLALGPRGRWVAAVTLLVVYTGLIKTLPTEVPAADRLGESTNVVRQVDLTLIGADHMWTRATSKPTDPEGLLSTIPSIVTALMGYAAGRFLRAAPISAGRAGLMFAAGLAVAAAGIVWDIGPHPGWGMPINKALWTPSFVLLTGGLGAAALAICLFVFDIAGAGVGAVRRVATAFEMVGVNAIFVFVASGFAARALTILNVGDVTLKGWLYDRLFVSPLAGVGLADPRLASVAFAAAFVGCWWLILWGMWRRGWTIRV